MAAERNIYLKSTDIDEAMTNYLEMLDFKREKEVIDVLECLGRKSSEAVFAVYSSPNFNAAAMDGIAVRSKDTNFASEYTPLNLKRGVGFEDIDTGDPLKDSWNAVIMIEDVNFIDEDTARIIKPASSWQNVRAIGEDIVSGEMIIPANHKIRAVDIGALLSGGITKINVWKKISVGIIPTGTEIVEPGNEMKTGDIIESNSRIFEGMSREAGALPLRYGIVEDNYEKLKNALRKSVDENDITVINAGSSAGREDFTPKLIKELGRVLYHGLSIKPGKPAVLGIVNNKPVVGIPGYPVSAYIVFEKVVKEVIRKFSGENKTQPDTVEAKLSRRIVSSVINKEFVRMKIGKVGENIIATPLDRGAGVLMSLVRSDGFLVIPQKSEGFEAGEKVSIELTENNQNIENTLVSIGSHDLIMDILNNYIHKTDSSYSLSSAHTGSMGGIIAVKKGEAHMAPVHLLDENTGVYNVSYIMKYLKDTPCFLVKGPGRVQGIIVSKGNPENIKGLDDLKRDSVTFVNRQRGSGTRLLLDCMLKRMSLDSSDIAGYEREMTTHMSVAAAVQSGSASAGIGVYSAAKALDMDFIPLKEEEYDFIIPKKHMDNKAVEIFLRVLKSDEFRNEIISMGGYTLDQCGKVIEI